MNDFMPLKGGLAGVGTNQLIINEMLHTISGRFAFADKHYDEMPYYFDELSKAIGNSYDENGGMSDEGLEVMAEFIAKNYAGVSHHVSRVLNDRSMYKTGVDKVEYTIDLPEGKFTGLTEYLQHKSDICVNQYKVDYYKAKRIKFLQCIEIQCDNAKVVVHYQPFGRCKKQKNRFAKISLNFSSTRRFGTSRIMKLVKNWFGRSYYSALNNAVPTLVEMRVDFNGIHPCMLAYRGNSRSKPKSNYQPNYKKLLESVLVSAKSSKAKKIYFKSTQNAAKKKQKTGKLIISRFEFIAKQYKSNNQSFNGKRSYHGVKQLDCKFFYNNDHGFKIYDMNFFGDSDLADEDFQWLVLNIAHRGFHESYVIADQRIRKILDRYILDTSKFMDDINCRFAKSLSKCKKLLCD